MTRTLGIDLASQPQNTAACLIEWSGSDGGIELLDGPLSDVDLLAAMGDPLTTKIAIDAPFGWPLEFVRAVSAFAEQGDWPIGPDDPDGLQARMVLRETDRHVRERTGKNPLSVSTCWIAYTAMRCARLLSALDEETLDRSGEGRVLEVYPDAALRVWGLSPAEWGEDPGGYKGKSELAESRRARLVDEIFGKLGDDVKASDAVIARMKAGDDDLDAVICALVARAAEIGRLEPIGPDQLDRARSEGWIRLPEEGSIGDLVA